MKSYSTEEVGKNAVFHREFILTLCALHLTHYNNSEHK
jgi:hypothetical protein